MYDIDLTDNWKQAAAQESVDYRAVESTFMTQAYGFVANKAKVLFRDPFRLGFEIVHRNEKATKMVGIFAFRCNRKLLYAPVFFVNGEIKGADMLYRSDVKRFIPLTDEWCSFLVRGANEEAGSARPRGESRQSYDNNMRRLAYPQRVKYAAVIKAAGEEKYESDDEVMTAIADGSNHRDLMSDEMADKAIAQLNLGHLAESGHLTVDQLRDLMRHHGARGQEPVQPTNDAEFDEWKNDKDALVRPTHVSTLPDGTPKLHMTMGDSDDDADANEFNDFTKRAADGSLFREILTVCAAADAPLPKLLPMALAAGGPDALVKLANLIEGSDIAQRFVAENYTTADLTLDPDWCVKKAAADTPDPMERYRNSVIVVRDLGFAKSAADRKEITERGYALEDYREQKAVNAVTTVIEDSALHEINTPGVVSILDVDNNSIDALLVTVNEMWMSDAHGGLNRAAFEDVSRRPRRALLTLGKKAADYVMQRDNLAIGNSKLDCSCLDATTTKPNQAKVGKAYVVLHRGSMRISDPFVVTEKKGRTYCTESLYGCKGADLIYRPGTEEAYPEGGLLNDSYELIEVKTEQSESHSGRNTVWSHNLMTSTQMDAWLRTGRGAAKSKDITVTKEPTGLFTLSAEGSDGFHKVARHLDMLGLHVKLAGDFSMRVDAAGDVIDRAEDAGTYRFRLFDTVDKSAYTTRMNPESEWMSGYDPVLNVSVTTPQEQRIGTTTPERPQQHHRIGDHYAGEAPTAPYEEGDDLPGAAIMSSSPEELATMAQRYDMPHIFDHQVIGNLAGNTYDTIEQVRNYIPDLETGVDRYARVLFLLRYRPADFEEAYGKDELLEMEQELTSLFKMAGESLLRMLKRFDSAKFSPQSDS